ncbi:2-dehydropantoate 2-reductase [Cupriavidus sp. SW-Y-13]|uniref:2-dehydropantoate 2-reductase n=1 Tax=Cupriavidus sp. SW-Y-13 TaxID=2653854 RepID=UPI001366127B|nr:2-dehydropantoate 2-reductase [Cupriavidus sp. SW-Y-13]MWL90255.1 2-dehydropantoate 2-reductase [Cupriavidus sp. SW-Y-13]
MKVCIVGAGAIGGWIGTKLAASGAAQVSALARRDTLTALRTHGWRMLERGTLVQAPVHADDDASRLGVHDVVVIAVKGPALQQVAAQIRPLIGPHTLVVPAMNGVPWWFCHGLDGFGSRPLTSVDPGGQIAAAISFEQVIGCVVHVSCAVPEPGLVDHKMGNRLIIGEPFGGSDTTARVRQLGALFAQAGIDAEISENVRQDIWFKLWGNLTMNPISAFTGATVDQILADPLTRAFCTSAMEEAAAIGARIGCRIDQSPEDRHAVTAKIGAFRTSMLQDVDAGRAIELDAIVGAVHEIGRTLGMPCPSIDALMGLTRLFGRVHGLYPEASAPG